MTEPTHEGAVDRALDSLAQAYDATLRNVAETGKTLLGAAHPGLAMLGSAVDDVLGGRADLLRAQQFEEWFRLLQQIVQALDEDKLERGFLTSPEFLSLFMRTAKEASSCWQKEKVRVFAQFLGNGMIKSAYPGYRRRTLDLIASLSMGHLELLRHFRDKRSTSPNVEESIVEVPLAGLLGRISEPEQLGFASDLASRLLLDTIPLLGGGISNQFRISDEGLRLLTWIEGEGASPRE